MDFSSQLLAFFDDDRMQANSVAVLVLLAATLLATVVVCRLFNQGSDLLVRLTSWQWLHGVHHETHRRLRILVFWLTVVVGVVEVVGGVSYHLAGRDCRLDVVNWSEHLTGPQLLHYGLTLGEVLVLVLAVSLIMRSVRRLGARLQEQAPNWLPQDLVDQGPTILVERIRALRRWFSLLSRYVEACLVLGALWAIGHIVGLGSRTEVIVGFALRVLTIVCVARLLTLACRNLLPVLVDWGTRTLSHTAFRRYWERVTRLFPFGERCFEAAVYVSATSLCLRELEFIAVVADFGPRVVQCIGIFFSTRVIIELLTVLLNEVFGLYEEDRPVDQKGQTLVPLLQSIGQYVLYFGSVVMMMGVLGIDTRPILAGAGILGLAGGLGAQSLVTDVVSGFFILFENQYLVGDYVQIGEASGRVEAVSIRHTQIRDEFGKLHIIPNGQVKSVINYSKGYVNAVVDIKVPAGHNLDDVFQAMAEAGRRLRLTRREALADTVIKGLVDLTMNEMTVRVVTKVQPGTHLIMQSEYRRLLKEVLDRKNEAIKPRMAA